MAFLVVTPSRAGYKLTAIFPVTGLGFRALANQLAGHICGVSLPFVPHLLWVLITIQTRKMGGGSLLPLYSNFRAFTKQGLLKSCFLLCDFFQLAGVCCVRVYSKYRLILLLATRLIY